MHEQTKATQKLFSTQVNALVEIIDGMGNPFDEESQDLLRLHSKEIMDSESVECVANIQLQGQNV